MPTYSAFWQKNYRELRNCCLTAKLEDYPRGERKKDPPEDLRYKLVKDLIDTGWMVSKGLKWIGQDKDGWLAWTDADGMLYRVSDLKRNDDGKRYEKEVGKIRLQGDGESVPSYTSATVFYQQELNLQKDCALCSHGGNEGAGDTETTAEEGGGESGEPKAKINVPGWQEYASGRAPLPYGADTSETTYTAHITDRVALYAAPQGNYGAYGGAGYGGGNDQINQLPYAPPVYMPTGVPNPYVAPIRNVTSSRTVVTDTSKVTFSPVLPPRPKSTNVMNAVGSYLPVPTYTPSGQIAKKQLPATNNKRTSLPVRDSSMKGTAEDFNIDAAVNTLNKNAGATSKHLCATYIRYALEAGGLNTSGNPRDAKDYGEFLTIKGFNKVSKENYKPQKGDIIVIQNYPEGNPSGHITMYNGSQWVSDFRQVDFWSGPGYRKNKPPYAIFRK